MSAFTKAELAREAEREVEMRRSLYPRWVAAGRMKADDAYRKIAIMEVIAGHLADEAEIEAASERLI